VSAPIKETTHNIGKLGTALTLLCSVHCVATPFLALFIPVLNNHGVDWLELAIIAGVIILGSSSLWHGYKGHHGDKRPLSLFAVGVFLLLMGMFTHSLEVEILHRSLMIGGSLLSAVAQIWNLKIGHYNPSHS
jgi:O-antigen/teichoic acid export membrane protein